MRASEQLVVEHWCEHNYNNLRREVLFAEEATPDETMVPTVQ